MCTEEGSTESSLFTCTCLTAAGVGVGTTAGCTIRPPEAADGFAGDEDEGEGDGDGEGEGEGLCDDGCEGPTELLGLLLRYVLAGFLARLDLSFRVTYWLSPGLAVPAALLNGSAASCCG